MATQHKVGLIITGDGTGAVKAVQLTNENLKKLNLTQTTSSRVVRDHSVATKGLTANLEAMRYAMGVIGPAIAAMGLASLVTGTVNAADEVGKLSTRLGISTEALSQYRHVAELSGVSFDAFTTSLQRQIRRIAEAAAGTGEAKGAIEELGLSAEQLANISPDQQFELLADALNSVANEGDRVRLAMKIWDSEGVKMLQATAAGSAGLRDMREEAEALGLTIGADFASDAAIFNDNITRMGGAIDGLLNGAMANFTRNVNEIVGLFQTFDTRIGQLSGEAKIAALTERVDQLKLQLWLAAQAETDAKDKLKESEEAWFSSQGVIDGYNDKIQEARDKQTWLNEELDKAEALIRAEKEALEKAGKAAGDAGKNKGELADQIGKLIGEMERANARIGIYGAELAELDVVQKADAEAARALAAGNKELAAQWEAAKPKLKALAAEHYNRTKKLDDEKKASERLRQEQERLIEQQERLDEAWRSEIEALTLEHAKLTMSERDYFALTLAVDGYTGAKKESVLAIWDVVSGIEAESEVLRMQQKEAKAAAEELQRQHEQIAGSLTDALLRGFEDGKGFAANFVDTLKNLFNTLVLRPIIQPIASAGASLVTGALGLGASGSASAGSLLSSGAGLAGGFSNLILGGASLFGGTAFGAGLGASGAAFGASGLLGGISGSLAAAGGFLANGSILAALGASMPVLLPALGIAAALGLFGGKGGDKTPDLQVLPGFSDTEIRQTRSGGTNIQALGVKSPFGDTTFRTKHDAFSSVQDAEAFASALLAIGDIEQAISDRIGPEMTDLVSEEVGQMLADGMRKLAEEGGEFESGLEQYLSDRFGIIFDTVGGQMGGLFGSITGGGAGAVEAATAVLGLFDAIDAYGNVFTDFEDALAQSQQTVYDRYQSTTAATYDLIGAFDGTLEATQELTAGLYGQYEATVLLLGEIERVKGSISGTIDKTIEDIRLSQMTDEERYGYFRGQAELEASQIQFLTDPAEIEKAINRVNQFAVNAWNTLSPEQQAELGGDFITFLEETLGMGKQRLSDLERDVETEQEGISDAVDDTLDANAGLTTAAGEIEAAAKSLRDAADAINANFAPGATTIGTAAGTFRQAAGAIQQAAGTLAGAAAGSQVDLF